MKDCLFCKIIRKEIPAEIVAENENCLAFKDIDPKAPVHILIIPKEHLGSTLDFSDENISLLAEMGLMSNSVSRELGLNAGGYRWVINTGKDGGQAVDHLHLHLLGGRQMTWPPG